jgi:hypothetical protein
VVPPARDGGQQMIEPAATFLSLGLPVPRLFCPTTESRPDTQCRFAESHPLPVKAESESLKR